MSSDLDKMIEKAYESSRQSGFIRGLIKAREAITAILNDEALKMQEESNK